MIYGELGQSHYLVVAEDSVPALWSVVEGILGNPKWGDHYRPSGGITKGELAVALDLAGRPSYLQVLSRVPR